RFHAQFLLANGDVEGYRRACGYMLDRWGAETHRDILLNLANACCWADGAVAPDRLLQMASKGQVPDQPSQNYRRIALALALHRAGKLDQAIPVLNEFAGVASLWPALAMAHHRAGKPEEAREWLNKADQYFADSTRHVLEAPTDTPPQWNGHYFAEFWILYREARCLIEGTADKQKEIMKAVQVRTRERLRQQAKPTADFDLALLLHPQEPRLWRARGRRHAELKQWDRAAADLARAAELKPDDLQIKDEHARIQTEQRKPGHIAARLGAAIDQKPDDPQRWIARGRFYAEQGEHKKADADFAQAASLTPDELNRFLEAGWWVAGPYPEKLASACPPEPTPDPSHPV